MPWERLGCSECQQQEQHGDDSAVALISGCRSFARLDGQECPSPPVQGAFHMGVAKHRILVLDCSLLASLRLLRLTLRAICVVAGAVCPRTRSPRCASRSMARSIGMGTVPGFLVDVV